MTDTKDIRPVRPRIPAFVREQKIILCNNGDRYYERCRWFCGSTVGIVPGTWSRNTPEDVLGSLANDCGFIVGFNAIPSS
jgi:hypothetical protein